MFILLYNKIKWDEVQIDYFNFNISDLSMINSEEMIDLREDVRSMRLISVVKKKYKEQCPRSNKIVRM